MWIIDSDSMQSNFKDIMLSADFFLDFFSISAFSKKKFQEYHQSGKQFGFRSGPTSVGSDLGLDCLQR